MQSIEVSEDLREATARRAEALFEEQRQHIFKRTDRLFAGLMVFQWIAGIVIALIISPRTWVGQYSQTHIHIWAALFLGGLIISLPVYMALTSPGKVITRHTIAVAQALTSALLIHLTGGRIETHFHVFGSLAFLAFYRDWRVLISASAVVALDHFARGVFWPQSVFGVLTVSSWRWLEHAAWVIFEDIFLIHSCKQRIQALRENADRQAQLETTKDMVESAIIERTAEFKANEERFRSLSDASPMGIFQADAEGQCIYTNPRWQEITGLTLEESLGDGWSRAIHPDDREAVLGEKVAAVREGRGVAKEFRFVTPEENTRWVYAHSNTLFSKDGRLIGYVGICEDITERKQAEEALRESEKKNRQLFNRIADPVVIFDKETSRFLDFNEAALRIYGYSEEELRNMTPLDLHPPEDLEKVKRTINIKNTDQPFTYTHITKDGQRKEVEILSDETDYEGHPAWISIIRDITERKLAEAELQKAKEAAEAATRAKSEFLANMSHEIRTPMNAIIGMSGLLLNTNLSAEQNDFAETIRSSSDALLTIINDILDFSKIESGKLDLEQHPFDLRDCIEESLDLLAAKVAEKGLDLAYMIDDNTPASLVGDSTRLRQVLVNLLSNAVKFTHEGEIVVSVSASPAAQQAKSEEPDRVASPALLGSFSPRAYEVRFAVSDTGIGIPQDRMSQLFKSFSQVDASTTRHYGGTGLGLAISKRLSELMGGSMWVESVSGHGSTFYFTVLAESAPSRPRVYLRSSQPDIAGRRLLIVDDSAANRRILTLQAKSWGMLPRAASSAEEAMEWIRQGDPFDLAVLDMQMPDVDGTTLAQEIRKHRDSQTMPLVMLTSIGWREDRDRAVKFDAFLTKPIKPSNLYDVFMEIFSGKTGRQKRPSGVAQIAIDMATRIPLRILLAEDNAVNQKVALKILERMGYRADVASNGLEAIEALRRQRYEIVLMDVQMPEMDGMEATRQICREWPNGNRPRIIAMTANAMQGDREQCLASGMDDYISKPVKVEELQTVLEQWGTYRKAEQEKSMETYPVDFNALSLIFDLDSPEGMEPLQELVSIFEEDAMNRLAQMRTAIKSGDARGLERAAHALKGCSANLGAISMSDLCADLEKQSTEGVIEEAEQVLERVETEFEKVRLALKSRLRSFDINLQNNK